MKARNCLTNQSGFFVGREPIKICAIDPAQHRPTVNGRAAIVPHDQGQEITICETTRRRRRQFDSARQRIKEDELTPDRVDGRRSSRKMSDGEDALVGLDSPALVLQTS